MTIKTPIIIVNFKTYQKATGKNAENLAIELQKASDRSDKPVAIAIENTDLFRVSNKVSIPIFSEHLDLAENGGYTGKITPLALKENGAIGSLINHSEDRIPLNLIDKIIKECKDNNLISLVCAKDSVESKKIAEFDPDFIAVEPPELIGGDISVSTAKPEVIENTVKDVKNINPDIKVLCGAGVKTKEDVKIAIKLGADGILLASGITKADDPKEKMLELLEGI